MVQRSFCSLVSLVKNTLYFNHLIHTFTFFQHLCDNVYILLELGVLIQEVKGQSNFPLILAQCVRENE